jgi:site-specific recombinase
VAPLLILAEFIYFQAVGSPIIDAEYAERVIKAHSIFGFTPVYAAITGVFLWLSSVFAGWIGNWFVFHELPAAIEYNKNLRRVLGWQRAKSISEYLRANIATLGGNISLGFFLGMTPKVAAFFGITLDSRHVTLSTGTIALAASVLGPEVLQTKMFAFAVAGVLVAGVLNVFVSFGLALWIAGRSQRLKKVQSWILYRRIISAFLHRPWRFVFPLKV